MTAFHAQHRIHTTAQVYSARLGLLPTWLCEIQFFPERTFIYHLFGTENDFTFVRNLALLIFSSTLLYPRRPGMELRVAWRQEFGACRG